MSVLVFLLALPGVLGAQKEDGRGNALPIGFQDVYGIELNVLEEPGEIELIAMTSLKRNASYALLECEYGFCRWFSLEVEVPCRFQGPVLTGIELEGTFSLIRREERGFLLVGGVEAFLPLQKSGRVEVESYVGLVKSFSHFAILGKLGFGLIETEESGTELEDEGDLSLALGPYFPLGKNVLLGIPLTLGGEGERVMLQMALDLNLNLAPFLRLFLLPALKISPKTEWSFSLGCFLELD